MHNYKELKVWQRSIELVTEIYRLSSSFPKEEVFGLTLQIRKAAVSISSNIAEGAGRLSQKEFKHFLGIAYGSSTEVETQWLVAKNLNYVEPNEYLKVEQQLNEVQKMLYKLIQSI